MKSGFTRAQRIAVSILALTAGFAFSVGVAFGASRGTLDAAFGSGGSVLSQANTDLLASAVQSNGDVVAVGEIISNGNPDVLVERFTPSGALDSTFGTGGVATGPGVSGAAGSIAKAVAVQANGQIVVVGKGTGSGGYGSAGMLFERYDANGSLDTSFGSGGVENVDAGSFAAGNAVAIQPNGDILAGGSVDLSAVPYAAVVRLTSSGSPDPTFGVDGVDQLQLGQYATVQSLALQSNGDIVLGGSSSPNGESTDGVVARISSLGLLDTSFNGTGAVTTQFAQGTGQYSSVNGVTVGSNGTIYAAGSATSSGAVADTFVASYTTAGAANTAFGSSGVANTPSANNWEEIEGAGVPGGTGIFIDSAGDLIVPGAYDDSTANTYGTLWAFTTAGALDSSFGTGGVAELKFANQNNSVFAGAAQSPTSGDIVAAGTEGALGGANAGVVAAYTDGAGSTPPTTTTTTTPPKPKALTLTVTGASTSYSAKTVARSGIKLTAACNQACKLALTLSTTSGTARKLGLTTSVKTCKKVKGKERCSTSKQYKALTLSSSATLKASGKHAFTLKLSSAWTKALEKHTGTSWTLVVAATPTTKGVASRSYRKTIKFKA